MIVEIAGTKLDGLLACWKIRRHAIGGLPCPLVEKQGNDRIAIKRIGLAILLRAILGHDECGSSNILNFGHRSYLQHVLRGKEMTVVLNGSSTESLPYRFAALPTVVSLPTKRRPLFAGA